jgi:hypothetical protein
MNTVERTHEDNNHHALSLKPRKVQLQSTFFLPMLHRRHDSPNNFHRVPLEKREKGNKNTKIKNYKKYKKNEEESKHTHT